MKHVGDRILTFIESNQKNTWLHSREIHIYIRNAHHRLDTTIEKTIDLATIEISEKLRGKGKFTKLLEYLEEQVNRPIYIENVLEERFQKFFEKRGYLKASQGMSDLVSCYYKLPNLSKESTNV